MKKFFLIMVALVFVAIVNTGCMTDYGYVRTVYHYESGYYYPPVMYAPVITHGYYLGSGTGGRVEHYGNYHHRPNGGYGNYHHNNSHQYNSGYSGGYNNGSPVYITPAPNVRGLVPRY